MDGTVSIPEGVRESLNFKLCEQAGLFLQQQNGEYDYFDILQSKRSLLLASNRIQCGSQVLDQEFRSIGALRIAYIVYLLGAVEKKIFAGQIEYGPAVDQHLPEEIKGRRYLQTNCLVMGDAMSRDTVAHLITKVQKVEEQIKVSLVEEVDSEGLVVLTGGLVVETQRRYHEVFEGLLGTTLYNYQAIQMGVGACRKYDKRPYIEKAYGLGLDNPIDHC